MRYFYLFWWNCGFKRQNSFVGFERFTRTTHCVGCVYPHIYANCAALVLIYSDSLGLARNVPNLRGIRDNLPAFGTWQIYSLSPRPEINKNTALSAVFLFILVELWIQTRPRIVLRNCVIVKIGSVINYEPKRRVQNWRVYGFVSNL